MCASTADRDSADGPHAAHRQVCGAIVRCFKYLINDYHVEFTGSLLALVQRLHISAGLPDAATTRRWRGMEALYGSGVFPEGLLDVLNMGASRWEHRVPAGAPAGAAEAARGRLGDLLRKKLLQVDEHPILSRMFTFRGHVDTLLLFVLLGKQEDVLRVQAVKPRERNRNRLRKVLAFLREEATPQYLRRASLSLGVLDHVQRWLEARAPHSVDGCTARRKPEHGSGDPVLVRLGKGQLEAVLVEHVDTLVSQLHLDPDLDVGACVTHLLGVVCDAALRFKQYREYPYACWRLCKAYNGSAPLACVEFLRLPPSALDVGFGSPLQQLALDGFSEPKAVDFLLRDDVQPSLANVFAVAAVSSLPAGRAFASLKRNEAPWL